MDAVKAMYILFNRLLIRLSRVASPQSESCVASHRLGTLASRCSHFVGHRLRKRLSIVSTSLTRQGSIKTTPNGVVFSMLPLIESGRNRSWRYNRSFFLRAGGVHFSVCGIFIGAGGDADVLTKTVSCDIMLTIDNKGTS